MTQVARTGASKETGPRPKLGGPYWRMWWASAISTTGDGAFSAALPLLAVTITRDPRLVSVVTAATYLPWMLFSLPAGAIVDRYDRATLMWRSQAVQAVIVAAITVGIVFHHADIALLGLAGFGLGCADRTPAEGQRQPADQPDRGGVVPRPAGRQPAVRRGRGAAVRPGCRLVRRFGRAGGHPAQSREARPGR
jgi:MFS family permease